MRQLINDNRDIKVFRRRLKHFKGKKNRDQLIKLKLQQPSYTLDRIIKERYIQSQILSNSLLDIQPSISQ
jgi:hypothetical protein